jgi:hypothetical protein
MRDHTHFEVLERFREESRLTTKNEFVELVFLVAVHHCHVRVEVIFHVTVSY